MIEKIIGIIFLCFALVTFYSLFIWAPYNVYAESQCLAKGYPEYRVSVGLETYCMNLDGSLTVKVDKLK